MARGSTINIALRASFDGKALRNGAAEIERISKAMRGLGAAKVSGDPLAPLAKSLPKVATGAQTAQKNVLMLARAQAALQKENGSTAAAVQTLQRALTGVSQTTPQAVNAMRQLARYQREVEQGANRAAGSLQVLPRTINGLSGAAAQFASVAAGAFAAERVVAFGAAAIGAANNLEDAKSSLKAISGDQATYNNALEVAAQNQRLFGGSLAENINEMGSFVVSSRLAGVELDKLLDISQRLATLDPGQGAAGAAVALRELLSGNERSLTARFELPAAAIKAIGDDSLTASQKLDALGGFLDEVGISSATVQGKLENNSQAFRDLAAAGDAVQASVGAALANALAPFANQLAQVGQFVAANVGSLNNLDQVVAQAGASALAGATNYDEYAQRIAFVNEKIAESGVLSGSVDALSKSQFAFAQSLIESGVAASEAYSLVSGMSTVQQEYAQGLIDGGVAAGEAAAAAAEFGSALDAVNSVQGQLWDDAGASSDQLQHLGDTMLNVAGSSEENRAAIEDLAAQYLNGEINSNQLEDAVLQLEQAQLNAALAADIEAANQALAAAATAESEMASIALADSLAAQAAATDTSTMAGQAQKDALDAAAQASFEAANAGLDLEAQARAAADALFASGNAGLAAANMLAQSINPTDQLTAAMYRLAAAKAAAGAGGGAVGGIGANVGAGAGAATAGYRARAASVANFGGTPVGGGAGGGRARGGGSARASEAQQTQQRLQQIAEDGGARIAEINEQTAQRLVEIDRDAAAERARIAAQLQQDLQSDAAQGAAAREANDLDLIGEDDAEQLAKLQAREQAEMEAAQRMADAQARARQQIADGNADAAAAEYEAAKQAIEQREELDRNYYEKRAELAGNEEAQAALDKEYQEAVKAQEEAARVEQEIKAAQVAEQRAAVEEEKAAVIAAAEEQKTEVVKKAQEQAEGVKGASEGQRTAVIGDLAAQAQAVTDWAAAYEAAAGRAAAAAGRAASAVGSVPSPGGGGPAPGGGTAAAGGGTFVTSGPATFVAGDNPGGVELVTVTPLSGKGQTRTGAGVTRMAGGGALLAGMPDLGELMRGLEGLGDGEAAKGYADALRALLDAVDSLRGLASVASIPAIDPRIVEDAARVAREVVGILRAELVPLAEEETEQIGAYLDAAQGAVDLLAAQRDVANLTSGYRPPVDEDLIRDLLGEARRVVSLLVQQVVPLAEYQAEQLARYRDVQATGIDILLQTAGLGRDLQGYRPPVNLVDVRDIAKEAVLVAQTFTDYLLPATDEQVAGVDRYAALVGAAISGLTGVLDLRERLAASDLGRPLDQTLLMFLAIEAQRAAATFRAYLLPLTESTNADISRYAAAVQAGLSSLSAVVDLRRRAMEGLGEPISQEVISKLAQEAQQIAATFRAYLLPLSEQEARDAQRYADTVASSVGVLQSLSELSAEAFEGYTSPTDAQLKRVADDARRIAEAFGRAAQVMAAEGITQAGALAEATQKAVGAARDSLLVMQAINDQTFALDLQKLSLFEQNSMRLYDSLERMGARAAQIPAGNLDAVTAAAAALKATSEAFTALGAVPFDNLGALAGSVGAGSSTVVNNAFSITIYQQPGQDARALVDQMTRAINQQIRSRA